MLPEVLDTPQRKPVRELAQALLSDRLPTQRTLEVDAAGAFPGDVWAALGETGLLGLGISEEVGGSGGDVGDSALVTLEIARRLPSLAVDYVLCGMVARTIAEHGTSDQRAWLAGIAEGSRICAYGLSEPDVGTDLLRLRTRAEETADGWVLNGRKQWISLAEHAELIFVLARTSPPEEGRSLAHGLSLIAVPTDQPGVGIQRTHLAGMRAAGTCEVVLTDAVAPAGHLIGTPGRGFHLLRDTLNIERVLAACLSLGIGRGALDLALSYAGERSAFGRPIGGMQALQHGLADSAAELGAATSLVDQAVHALLAGTDATSLSAMAKLISSETSARITDRGMRLMAAHGLSVETPMQMFFRDARLQLFSPVSNEMVRNMLGEALGLPRSY
ncbi:MAG: acyl-CoA dehydrogenase family protein [Nocardiopsaceae bacterium]|nr:acyl-CoA dehydrogenase family protein [Nocardiopsaceae bacterium]